ncbi:MAG: hypothetical protein ABIJ92_02110 [Candidatus Aenigmatarchaeota archaeon]
MIIVGTHHKIDLEGYNRISYLLGVYSPKVISVEFPKGDSPEQARETIMNIRDQKARQIRSYGLDPGYEKMVLDIERNGGYEVIAAIDYARSTGAEVHFVDHPKLPLPVFNIPDLSNSIGERLDYKTFRALFVSLADASYTNPEIAAWFDEMLRPEIIGDNPLDDPAFQEERENIQASEIIRVDSQFHTGGMYHAFGDDDFPVPLHKRLGSRVTQSIALVDAYNHR